MVSETLSTFCICKMNLEKDQLGNLVKELSCWNPVPYPLLYVAKHELQCQIGLMFFVDTWPSATAIVVVSSHICEFPYMKKSVFLDAKDPSKLLDLLIKVPIDWTNDFHFTAIPQRLSSVCEEVCTKHGILYGHICQRTMVQQPKNGSDDISNPRELQGRCNKNGGSRIYYARMEIHWKFYQRHYSTQG